MPLCCPSRFPHRPLSVVRAVVVGSVLSAVLPANATDTVDFRRAPPGQAFESPNTRIGLPLPASVLDVPVHLRVRAEDVARSDGFEIGPSVSPGVAPSRPAGISRQAVPIRPTVTILTPTDLAAVPAGTLRVRGTVSANGDKVRVLVNGERAVVQMGTFAAAVGVTPHTMILSAVATTPKGLTACHQIGLAVSGTPETAFRLRTFPGYGVVARTERFSFLPAAVSASAQGDQGVDGAGDTPAAGPGRLRFTFGRVVSYYPPMSVTAAADANDAPTMTLVLVPASLDERRSAKEPGLPERRLQVDVERTRSVLVMNPGPEALAESTTPNTRGSSATVPAGIGSLAPRQGRDGEVEQNPRGMPLGTEYSVGVLFIFDTGGFWRVRWY